MPRERRSTMIFRESLPSSRRMIHVELDEHDGKLRIIGGDSGSAPAASFGGDIDFWTDVAEADLPALAHALASEMFRDDPHAVTALAEFCEARGIAYRKGRYP